MYYICLFRCLKVKNGLLSECTLKIIVKIHCCDKKCVGTLLERKFYSSKLNDLCIANLVTVFIVSGFYATTSRVIK